MSKKKRPLPQSLGLPLAGVDSHAHLDLEDFSEDLDGVFQRAAESGVARICNVFLGSRAYRANRGLFADRDNVFFNLGFHPNECHGFDPAEIEAMREDFRADPRLRAVGEIGLDYYWDRAPRDRQLEAFRLQLELARELDLPVVIHSRQAEEDTVAVLLEQGFRGRPLLWHCFGGDAAMARTLLDNGWHISVPGPATYPKNVALREAVAVIPSDRLLLETDCPYLSPQDYRGKRNEPAYLAFTCVGVAQLRGEDPAETWAACGSNSLRFFGVGE